MAKINEITFSVGRTLQVKQYEPINIHISAKAEVQKDAQKEMDELQSWVYTRIGAEEMKWQEPKETIKALQKNATEEFKRQSKKLSEPF